MVANVAELITCGAINWDINLFMERLPRAGEEIPIKEIQRVSGGTAANVAVAATRLLGKKRVAFIGALGKDEIADKQRSILWEEGVDDSGLLFVQGEESGQAYISIGGDGENEIHTYFGANLRLDGPCLRDTERLKLIVGAKVCVIMDPPLETARCLAELCREHSVTVIWDPGVYAELGLDALMPTLVNTDYFILNHVEYENLLGTSSAHEIVRRMHERVKGLKCIIKHGSEGCTLTQDSVGAIIHINAVPLDELGMIVVNTVGCGDAFIGGFASAKVEGFDDTEALRWGNVGGSFKATRKETRGSPTKAQFTELSEKWRRL
jgi:ribokinase